MYKWIKALATLTILIFVAAFIGCDNDGGGGSSQEARALTEHDFGNDTSLRADPERHLIVKFLEHPDSEQHENDTGGMGHDIIPHTYTRTLRHTFCWEDHNADAEHFMVLEDSVGNEILRLDVGDCVTEVIVAGDYVMITNHDGRIEKTHTIFIIPDQNGGLGAKKEETIPEGILKRAGGVLSNILVKLDISITKTTKAQTFQDDFNTLISTCTCFDCNLPGLDLSGPFSLFEGIVLTRSNLRGANFSQAIMENSVLALTDLTNADLTEANLSGANLSGAILTRAILSGANLSGANLSGADLSGASLICSLNPLGVCIKTILTGADFSGAIWIDGVTVCAPNSIGTCL